MAIIVLILAIFSLVVAHYFKVYRLEQFIKIYEKPNRNNLVQALSLGYIINFLLPFRAGDLFRAWFSGKKMKNGFSFSLATIIIDRILDILCVAVIFLLFYLTGFKNETIKSSIGFYIIGGLLLLLLMILSFIFNRYIKIFIMKIAGIFNKKIELKILKFSWYIITSFKDLLTKINKIKILLYTIGMWLLYLVSYALFSLSMRLFGNKISLVEVFTTLFSKNSLDVSTVEVSFNNYLMFIYLLIPLIILIILTLLLSKKEKVKTDDEYLELLPQINFSDKLSFLEGYFSARSRDYFNNYIKLNRDISIIEDFSAGSNATTMLCTKDEKMFFRKYAFGSDSEKLYEQILWLEKHQKDLPLTKVLNVKKGNGFCSYDMPYIKETSGCFNFVHSMPISIGWNILKRSLDSLNDNLHTKNVCKADKKTVEKYIESKVEKNLSKIMSGEYIKPLLKYDYLIINGKKYHNIKYFEKYLEKDYLLELFLNDEYSEIHGDFTIENIICINKNNKQDFYIIDPNTGNLHDSPNLDYAKLLQSLHGGYEFLMKTKTVQINDNNINYLYTRSSVYNELFVRFEKYLNKKFDKIKVKSIFFHEVIHWLRLIPYKIEKNGERSILFYCGLIIVLNEIIDRYGDIE